MQVLAHNPEIEVYSDETGNYAKGFLIGTKYNEARWKINKDTGHDKISKFIGTDFAIIPELITTPLSKGGGGHYFGQDTKKDLLKGYAENSHGKYHKILGPYSYNDGTDDYFYNAIIKLRDSKAASELVKHGSKTWEPFAISPHIWPLAGPDDNIYDWEPIGGALVIKGAYGPQAVISKLCKGTSAACEKSLGGSHPTTSSISTPTSTCEKGDSETAEFITSLVSKSASSQISMPENKEAAPAPVVTTLTADVAKPNATVNAQEAITTAKITTVVTPEQFAESEKANEELRKQVTQLLNDKKINTLNNMFAKVEEKAREELVKKYSKHDNIDQLKEFLTEVYPLLRASEEEQKEEDKPEEVEKQAKKGKSASLPAEPSIPKDDNESKAASVPVNKLLEILRFQNSGGRA